MITTPPHIELRNQWRIPRELARLVASRDVVCIYCGNDFAPIGPKGNRRASWEHIINDVELITPENIAVCCVGCNASKGTKNLHVWLQSPYCAKNAISAETLAPVARAALALQPAPANTPNTSFLTPTSPPITSSSHLDETTPGHAAKPGAQPRSLRSLDAAK